MCCESTGCADLFRASMLESVPHGEARALFGRESGKKNESKVNQTAIQPISNAPKSNTHRVEVVTNTSYC